MVEKSEQSRVTENSMPSTWQQTTSSEQHNQRSSPPKLVESKPRLALAGCAKCSRYSWWLSSWIWTFAWQRRHNSRVFSSYWWETVSAMIQTRPPTEAPFFCVEEIRYPWGNPSGQRPWSYSILEGGNEFEGPANERQAWFLHECTIPRPTSCPCPTANSMSGYFPSAGWVSCQGDKRSLHPTHKQSPSAWSQPIPTGCCTRAAVEFCWERSLQSQTKANTWTWHV